MEVNRVGGVGLRERSRGERESKGKTRWSL